MMRLAAAVTMLLSFTMNAAVAAPPKSAQLWEAMLEMMQEPASTYYRHAVYVENSENGAITNVVLCGEYDTKRTGGDYVGLTPFIVKWDAETNQTTPDIAESAVRFIPELCGSSPPAGVTPRIEHLKDMPRPQ